PCQRVQMPAKTATGRSSLIANQTFGVRPLASFVGDGSAKLVHGTAHLRSMPCQARQREEDTLRMFVTPRSAPFTYCGGEGMPHWSGAISRSPSSPTRTTGAR